MSDHERTRMEAFWTNMHTGVGWGRTKTGDYHAPFARWAWAAWQEAQREAPETEVSPSWQPIETAPKDGTNILLGYFREPYGSGGSCEVAFWHGIKNTWCGRVLLNTEGFFSPSHWIPLPTPPAVSEGVAP